jgi:hypothetical protein
MQFMELKIELIPLLRKRLIFMQFKNRKNFGSTWHQPFCTVLYSKNHFATCTKVKKVFSLFPSD